MNSWKHVLIKPQTTILKTIEIIDAGAMQIALVVNDDNKLLGTVSDGDIRRAILRGIAFDRPVSEIMFTEPTVASCYDSRETIVMLMKKRQLRQIPILDENRCVVGLDIWTDLLNEQCLGNPVVLMAGGLGSRLGDLTKDCPKPLLKVGNKPVLEIILENCRDDGFRKFFISVNYKAEMVKDYFGNGSRWGVEIEYVEEKKRLGTAGALGLLATKPTLPMIVMNADVLTKINLKHLLDFHESHNAVATMCVRQYEFQVPFGVVQVDSHRLKGICEKPKQQFFVNAGIYVLNPECLDHIPENEFFDMPTMFERLMTTDAETAVFPIHEYWLDIGRVDDYERANGDYKEVFS